MARRKTYNPDYNTDKGMYSKKEYERKYSQGGRNGGYSKAQFVQQFNTGVYDEYRQQIAMEEEQRRLDEQRRKNQEMTKMWEDMSQQATYSPQGDMRGNVYAEKMKYDTMGRTAYLQDLENQRRNQHTYETQRGAIDELQAEKRFMREAENARRELEEWDAYLKAQYNTSYDSLRDQRTAAGGNGTGMPLTREEFLKWDAEQKKDRESGALDKGNNPWDVSEGGLEDWLQRNRKAAEEYSKTPGQLWADVRSYKDDAEAERLQRSKPAGYDDNREEYDEELYDNFNGKGEYAKRVDAIETDEDADALDRELDELWARYESGELPVFESAYEKGEEADKRIAELTANKEQKWEQSRDAGDRYFDFGTDYNNWASMTPEQRRNTLWMEMMGEDYATAQEGMTAAQKREMDWRMDLIMEKALQGKTKDFNAAADAFSSLVKQGEAVQKYREDIKDFDIQAEGLEAQGYTGQDVPAMLQENKPKYVIDPEDTEEYPRLDRVWNETEKAVYTMNFPHQIGGTESLYSEANKYMFATEEQINQANIFYEYDQKNGTHMTEAFLEGIDSYLTSQLSKYQEMYARSMADQPVQGTIARVASYPGKIVTSALGAIGSVASAAASVVGAKVNQDTTGDLFKYDKLINVLREQQNTNAADWVAKTFGEEWRNRTTFALGVVDSIADNLMAMAVGSKLAGVSATTRTEQNVERSMKLVQLIMSAEATSSTMIEKLDSGMGGAEAAVYAVGNGIIEWLTERYSLEQILKPDVQAMLGKPKQLISFLAKSSAAEGSEEIASDLLNMGLDSVVSYIFGHENELRRRVNEYITNENMTAREAEKRVLQEKLGEIAQSGLAGALSGLGMAGGRTVANKFSQVQAGRNVRAEENGLQKIIDLAKGMEEGTESRALAEKLEGQKKVSNGQLGKLSQLIITESSEERGEVIRGTVYRNVAEDLKAAGVENASEAAEVITRNLTEGNEKLSRADMNVLAKSEAAIKVWQDYNSGVSLSAEKTSQAINSNTKNINSVIEQTAELTSPTRTATGKLSADIMQSVRNTSSAAEAIDDFRQRRSWLMSESYAQLAKDLLESDKSTQKSKNYLDDVMKIRLAGMTLAKEMPQTGLENAAARALFTAAKEEFNEADKARLRNQVQVVPGQGVATIDGAQYGTDAWDTKLNELKVTQDQRQQLKALAEVTKRLGNKLDVYNNTETAGVYGFEDATGTVHINLAGLNRNGMSHHMLVTMSHELTHWLEQNSWEGYNQLRSFVLDSLRSKGVSIEDSIIDAINNQNVALGAKSGKALDISGAMAEVVAKSCENLLSSKAMEAELRKANPELHGKIKNFVRKFVARLRAAIQGMTGSLSKNAQTLYNETEKIAQLWLGARQEALNRTAEGPLAEAGPEGVSFSTIEEIQNMSQAERDAAYMEAVNSGDVDMQQFFVRLAAKEAGAIANKRGWPIKLYHGTRHFGFTVFDTSRTKFNTGAIFTTDSRSVASGYSEFGNDRGASSKYIEDDGTDKTLIKNAKNVLNENWRRITETDVTELRNKLMEQFREMAEIERKAVELDKGFTAPEEIENEFWNVVGAFDYIVGEDQYYFDTDKQWAAGYRERNPIQNYYEQWRKIREYYSNDNNDEEYQRLKEEGNPYYQILLNNYDHSDALVELEHTYKRLINSTNLFIREDKKNIASRESLQNEIDNWRDQGNYSMYGFAGDKMLDIDAEKSFWTGIKAPVIGDGYFTTDYIVSWAKKNGYTSVVIRNVMDPGIVNEYGDDYVFFDSNQLKSADLVTYDDNGKVIPLSERFQVNNPDIRYSTADDAEDRQIKLQVNSHISELMKNESVADISSNIDLTQYYEKGARSISAAYKAWANDLMKKINYQVNRENFGIVEITKSRIKTGFGYDMNNKAKAAFAAVPDIIQKGELINEHDNHKGNAAVQSTTFAGKIMLDGEPQIMAVVVTYTEDKNRYKTHKVFMPDGTVLTIEKEASVRNEEYDNNHTPPIRHASNDNITQEADESKRYSTAENSELLEEMTKARDEVNQLREKKNALKPELDAWVERILEAQKNGNMDETLEAYKEWEKGYSEIDNALKEAQKRRDELSKAYDEYQEQRDVAEEQKKIVESGLPEEEWRRKQAVKEFGYTPYFYDAGYMLPNGKLLNFSGEKGRHFGTRGQDHRAIEGIYASSKYSRGDAMVKFMAEGNIRVMAETPGLDINSSMEPTAEQYAAIRKMAREYAKEEYFNVDFTDERGNTVDSIEYDGRVNADRIVNDIKTFYRTGAAPQQSVVSQFHYSTAELDEEYNKAVSSGDTARQQELVYAAGAQAGYTIKAYHGTGRADRVGTVFRPERATSGPMAFFTDDRGIAENYARDKQDTSIAYDEEYGDYHTQFRVKDKKGKSIPVSQLWNTLSYRERSQILERAKHIAWDDEIENIIYDPEATSGNGGFQEWNLRENRGNAIETLINAWLDGGDLYNQEERFLEVLKLAGIENVTWNNPDARVEKVYDTLLKIQNPFSTSDMFNNEFIDGLLAWWDEQDQEKYSKESAGADLWDKNNRTIEQWADMARDNVENGRTTVWTSIPDAVTDYLKAQGYDGIKDEGGKGGGTSHTVWIPFSSEQVKSADPITRDDAGNVIPLSERFNEQEEDIRWSTQESPDMDVNNFMMGLQEFNMHTNQEKTMLRQYKDLHMNMGITQLKLQNYEKKLRELRAIENPSVYDRDQIRITEQRIKTNQDRLQRLRNDMVRATKDNGYARQMMKNDSLMKNLVNGVTADQMVNVVQKMMQQLGELNSEMQERAKKLQELGESATVLQIRQQFNRQGLKRIAAQLKEQMNSEVQNREIENRLALIALKMKEGKFDKETTSELVDMILGNMRGELDTYVLSTLRGERISLSPAQLKELKAKNSSIRELNAQLAGTGIMFTTSGDTNLEHKWGDLCDKFTSLDRGENNLRMVDELMKLIKGEMDTVFEKRFSDTNVQGTTEMVLKAAAQLVPEIVKDAKSLDLIKETMQYAKEVAEQAKGTAAEVFDIDKAVDRIKKTGSAVESTASTLTGDIKTAMNYFNDLSEQSEAALWKRERLALIDQLKSESTMELLMEREKWRKKIEKDQTAREKMQSNMHLRQQIHTNFTRLRKLLINETDQKNIPEHMKGLAREMLGLITNNDLSGRKLTGMDSQDLIETRRVLDAMQRLDGEFTPDDLRLIDDEEAQAAVLDALADIEDGIGFYNNKLGKDIIANLQGLHNALVKISEGVSTISSVISAERSISFLTRRIDVADAAEDVKRGMANSRFKGELTGRGHKAVDMTKSAVFYGNMTPVYYFKMLRNGGMDAIWEDIQEGENRNGLETQKAKDFMQQLAEKTKYSDWADTKKDVILGGKKVTVTIDNMMELYAIWQREHTTNPEMSQHLAKGGIFIQDEAEDTGKLHREWKQQRPIRVTDEEIANMYNQLSAQQKEYMESVVRYLSNDMSELGNKASMRMYGIKKYKELYYFPMKVWDGVKSARSDKGITGTNENRMAHKSWSKRRMHNAQNALVIGSFTKDAVNHIVEMINYNTMAPGIENMNKILNYQFTEGSVEEGDVKRNLRIMFQEYYGREALKYLETFIKDMNGGVAQDQRRTLRDKALTIFKKNAVAGSLSVVLQQPLSYIRAAMIINPKYMATAPVRENWKDSYREMMAHSGVAVIKDMGRFDMNFGQSAKDFITPETRKTALEKISDATTIAPQLADRMTWIWMWNAVKAEQAAQHKGMDVKSDKFLDLVGKRFNQVMRETQVYDSVLVKSSNMRSQNFGMKLITSFMAEPTLSLNVLADAVGRVRAGDEKAKVHLAKAGATFMLSAILQAVFKGLMGSGRSPDDKKTWAENFLNKFEYNLINEANVFSLIPGYSDLIEVLKTGKLQDDAMGAIGKLFTIRNTIANSIAGNGKGWYRDIEDTVGQFAQLFTNIPAKNLMRDARAVFNLIFQGNYAKRASSSAVIQKQRIENLANADSIMGTINSWLGEAGYLTTNKAYYSRMYNAQKSGNQAEADSIQEYLTLGKGVKEDTINSSLKSMTKADEDLTYEGKIKALRERGSKDDDIASWITKEYKEGRITRAEAEKLYVKANTAKTKDDAYFKYSQMEWEEETGKDVGESEYFRINDAMDKGSSAEFSKAVRELRQHGFDDKKINNHVKNYILDKYKKGEANSRTTENALKKFRSDMDENDIFWTMDRLDYQKQTKAEESVSGYYYRLTDAVNANKAEDIQKAVKQLLEHGIEKEKIKNKLSDWKSEYLAADHAGRVKINDALTKAYKAAGYTVEDAKETIDRWIKEEKKNKQKN